MINSDRGFDPLIFILGNVNISPWNPSCINDYIKDNLMKLSGSQNHPDIACDFTKLGSYIESIINQALSRYTDRINTFEDNNCPEISVNKEVAAVIPDCLQSIEENTDSPFHPLEARSSESPNVIESDVYENKTSAIIPHPLSRTIGIHPEIILTHTMVIIRITLPEGMSEKDIGISIKTGRAVIKWPSSYMEQIIPLPHDIIQNSARAGIKENILEVQIPRNQAEGIKEINL